MKIEVLGMGCPKCKKLYELVAETVKEMNLPAEVRKVDNINEIMGFGIMTTPALAVDGKVIAVGSMPSKDELKKWLSGDTPKSGGCSCDSGCCEK